MGGGGPDAKAFSTDRLPVVRNGSSGGRAMESSWSLSWSSAVVEFLETPEWGSLAPVDRFGIARGVHVASPVMPKNSLALSFSWACPLDHQQDGKTKMTKKETKRRGNTSNLH